MRTYRALRGVTHRHKHSLINSYYIEGDAFIVMLRPKIAQWFIGRGRIHWSSGGNIYGESRKDLRVQEMDT